MKSLIFLALTSLPSTLSLALHVRQTNATTPTATINAISPVLPPPSQLTQADVAPNCIRWDLIGSVGHYRCTDFVALYPEITYSDLILWNPSVGPACDNMWDSYWFCSAISGDYIPHPTHTPAGVPIKATGIPQAGSAAAPTCDRWDDTAPGASCQTFMSRYPGLSLLNLQTWNPVLIIGTNPCFLNYGFDLCTSVVGYVFVPPATEPTPTPPTGPAPPGPTQVGVAPGCMKWDIVEDGKDCAVFETVYGVTLEELVLWNPAIGSDCTNLWGGYAVCVGV